MMMVVKEKRKYVGKQVTREKKKADMKEFQSRKISIYRTVKETHTGGLIVSILKRIYSLGTRKLYEI